MVQYYAPNGGATYTTRREKGPTKICRVRGESRSRAQTYDTAVLLTSGVVCRTSTMDKLRATHCTRVEGIDVRVIDQSRREARGERVG